MRRLCPRLQRGPAPTAREGPLQQPRSTTAKYKLTNKIIGENFNLHPNYISSIMKVYTGIPLHQYILKARISHSIDLISEKKYSLTEIAEKCGFSDIYHYSKSFKKIIGISPGAYNKGTIT